MRSRDNGNPGLRMRANLMKQRRWSPGVSSWHKRPPARPLAYPTTKDHWRAFQHGVAPSDTRPRFPVQTSLALLDQPYSSLGASSQYGVAASDTWPRFPAQTSLVPTSPLGWGGKYRRGRIYQKCAGWRELQAVPPAPLGVAAGLDASAGLL